MNTGRHYDMLIVDDPIVGKETQMSEQSYAYEVVVSEKSKVVDGEKVVERAKQIIDSGSGLMEEPNRFKLLMKNAAKITELGAEESEVSVNIRPFLG